MSEREKPSLKDIEPLRPVDDEPPGQEAIDQVDRVGLAAANISSSPPAVGVTVEKSEEPPSSDEDPLEPLRRG